METIRVNMTPCEDIKTIHASQNDNEAREWRFELHNNGEKIDSSSISDQLVFKAYKGGTEEILPTNGSTPTTSPFKGDIKYPQGLLTNQQFTYRESPTEEDGLANIVDIKGQTLKWNQLIYNGNFTSTDGWVGQSDNPTLSVADNAITVTMTSGSPSVFNPAIKPSSQYPFVANHKYLFSFDLKATKAGVCLYLRGDAFGGGLNFFPVLQSANTWTSYKNIVTATNAESIVGYFGLSYGSDSGFTVGDSFSLRNLMMIDLTALGIADKTNAEILQWFADYYPLPYYDFNAGTLLSFNGTGLKVTGKNLFQNNAVNKTQLGITFTINDDKSITVNGTATGIAYLTHQTGLSAPNIKKGESLILSGSLNLPQSKAYFQFVYKGVSTGTTYSFVSTNASSVSINATEDMTLSGIYFNIASGATVNNMTAYPMLRYADTDSTYEPYTESVINLPISTYFPTGMKQVGDVYDELTPTKAITRIGAVDLGSLEWEAGGTNTQDIMRNKCTSLRNIISKPSSAIASANVVCINYATVSAYDTYIKTVGVSVDSVGDILVYDPNYNTPTSAGAFKTAMSGVYLYYELATETETPITTASLVTENAEIPLSNEDGVLIGECTEELSSESGFFDAKIKLADEDGECYSNKIQLHIERSPQ